MNKLAYTFSFLGIICFIYTMIIILYAGIKVSYLWIWPFVGCGMMSFGGMILYLSRKHMVFPIALRIIMISLIMVILVLFGSILGRIVYYGTSFNSQKVDYVIVLGAQVRGKTVSLALKHRLDATVSYLSEYPDTMVIVSGGQGAGEDISEAEAMYQYLIDNGVEPGRIIKEDKSTNTRENLLFSKIYVGQEQSVLIVSNSFHVYRAVNIAKKLGYENINSLPAKTDKIMCVHYYAREILAVLKYKLVGDI
ncbi:MAG: YdcF family protein [Lachnospiraceae bacterium]|nr:YdcF family protein [Lachnospiraceae bacterium]